MALRDKLRERAQPFLEPGESIQQVFLAQTGPTPWLAGAIGALVYAFSAKYRVVVVTDRAIILLKSGAFMPAKPSEGNWIADSWARGSRAGEAGWG